MNMSFVLSVEEVLYKKRPARSIPQLRPDGFTLMDADSDLWRRGDHVRKEWFSSNSGYWARNIDFGLRLRHRVARNSPLFVRWHKVKVLLVLLARCNDFYVMVPDLGLRFEYSNFLYVPTLPIFP